MRPFWHCWKSEVLKIRGIWMKQFISQKKNQCHINILSQILIFRFISTFPFPLLLLLKIVCTNYLFFPFLVRLKQKQVLGFCLCCMRSVNVNDVMLGVVFFCFLNFSTRIGPNFWVEATRHLLVCEYVIFWML